MNSPTKRLFGTFSPSAVTIEFVSESDVCVELEHPHSGLPGS